MPVQKGDSTFAHHSFVTPFKTAYIGVYAGNLRRMADCSGFGAIYGYGNIFAHRLGIEITVLQHESDVFAQRFKGYILNVPTVDINFCGMAR